MKNDLSYLIKKIDVIKKHFHISVGNGIQRCNNISDIHWEQKRDTFINSVTTKKVLKQN